MSREAGWTSTDNMLEAFAGAGPETEAEAWRADEWTMDRPAPDAWRWELDPSDPEHPDFGGTLEAFEADRIEQYESTAGEQA